MVDENSYPGMGTAMFNQAMFMQIRLNELFARIDLCSINPTAVHEKYGSFNYKIIANDLFSAFQTISSKLKPDEKESLNDKRNAIITFLIDTPPHITKPDCYGKIRSGFNQGQMFKLSNLFLEFRLELEKLMELRGLGNPSKQDPTKASLNM